ncbi:MAG: diguanylate cyclase [Butyrivibrio sp.]|nr:diguanylate cyclase [Butyrivibrio sp.]
MGNIFGLYIEVDIICMALLAIIIFKSSMGILQGDIRNYFLNSIISLEAYFFTHFLYAFLDFGVIERTYFLEMLINTLYFASIALAGYCVFIYFEKLQNAELVSTRKNRFIIGIPLLVYFLLLLTNVKTGIIFYLDENYLYHRGAGFVIHYIVTYVYMGLASVFALLRALDKENYAYRDKYYSLAFFPVIPAIFGIADLFLTDISFAVFGITMAEIILYSNNVTQMITQDMLTGLNNRARLVKDVQKKINDGAESGKSIYLIMFDIDKFKIINDKYGHLEGDNAIISVANVLKKSCQLLERRPILARYGGDEFVMCIEAHDDNDVNMFMDNIDIIMDKENIIGNKPYDIEISKGVARYSADTMKSIKDFVDRADKELYKNKYDRKRKA